MYIGVDLGTSAVKLLLLDDEGKIRKTVSKEYPLMFPHTGWSEQDPKEWLEKTLMGIKELVAGDDLANINGIGVGGQMHGLVILDENDEVIRPAILWNDGRTQEETDYLNNVIGKDKLSEYTGNIAFAGFTAPKVLWVQKNEPENFGKIKKMMLPKDYLVYKLTGEYVTDYSDASGTLLLDVKNKKWSSQMLEICGLNEAMMPRLCESYEVVGTMKPEYKEELGLTGDIKFVAGAGDNAAAAVGTGTVGAGRCNISLGTSGTIFITNDSFRVDDKNSLHSFDHADGGFHLMGCMLSAASCNKWFMDEILQDTDYKSAQVGIEAGKGKEVYFLPYLMGERSPHNDPAVRGAFLGLSMDTTRKDMILAVLEGVAFGLRDSLEVARSLGINVKESNICGGGAKSPLWKTIIANVMNIDLLVLKNDEGPALGGAILAAVGCGMYADVKEASYQLTEYVEKISPDPELAAYYEEKYRKFKAMYPAIKSLI